MINHLKTLLASAALIALCSQANAGSEIFLKNNTDGKMWVRFTEISGDAICKQTFPYENDKFNLILEPRSSTKAGPFEGDCLILISGSVDNKFYYFCKDNFDLSTDVKAEFSIGANGEAVC